MQLVVCCTVLLLILIRRSCGSQSIKFKGFKINGNSDAQKCLESLISITDWVVHDFSVIFDDVDIVEDHFFHRYSNFGWKLYSTGRSMNLTGFSNVILFTNNFDTLTEALGVINIRRMDSRAKFVISLAKNFETWDEIAKASDGISAAMWNLDKTDVLYLVPCRGDILAMTYFPFARNCQAGDLEVLDIWREKSFVKGAELFPEKMLDIRGCPQNHTVAFPPGSLLQHRQELAEDGKTMVQGGVGGRLVTIVAEKMNMQLNPVLQPPYSWPLLVDHVARGESLFAISGSVPLDGQTEVLALSSGYMEESFGFGYIIGSEVSWRNLAGPLSWEVWQYTVYTGLLFCGLVLAANQYHRGEIIYDRLKILDAFGIFLGTARALPRSYFGRYLFGMWIVYSYLINASYNRGLVSFLTTPNERRPIETFEDLFAEGIDFGGGTFHREFYNDPSDPMMMKIYDNFKVWPEIESERLLLSRRCVTGVLTSFVYMWNRNQTGNDRGQLRMLREKALTFQVPISLRRGSPFTFGVHRYASLAIQGGFGEYWLKYYTSVKIHGGKTPTVISMKHFGGILYLHIIGLTLSCVVLLGEMIFHKYFRNSDSH